MKSANVDIRDGILLQLLLEFSYQTPVEQSRRINYKWLQKRRKTADLQKTAYLIFVFCLLSAAKKLDFLIRPKLKVSVCLARLRPTPIRQLSTTLCDITKGRI